MKAYIQIIILAAVALCVWYVVQMEDFDSNGPTQKKSPEVNDRGGSVVGSDDSHSQYGSEESSIDESNSEKPSSTQQQSGHQAESTGVSPVRSAFNYEIPIASAYELQAAQGPGERKESLRNLSVWMEICEEPELTSHVHASSISDNASIGSKVGVFCEGFSTETVREINEHVNDSLQRTSDGSNDSSSFNQLIRNEGVRTAAESALTQLQEALNNLDFGRTLQLVWQLGSIPGITTNLGDAEIERAISRSPKVFDAVAVSLYCHTLASCGPDHPVTIFICLRHWPSRECADPRDVHDAIRQLLTGKEYDEYLEMSSFITARIRSPR